MVFLGHILEGQFYADELRGGGDNNDDLLLMLRNNF